MRRRLRDVFTRLLKDQCGNVFILFAATSVPLLLAMGGAVDFARYARYKAELANAVDAAALALARQGQEYTEAQATTFVQNYVASLMAGVDDQFTVESFDVDKTSNGYIVKADGSMEAMFLPLGFFVKNGSGMMSLDLNIVAEVVHSSNQVELALVFDNTGSMNWSGGSNPCGSGSSRMAGLKCAATILVEDLMGEMNDTGDPQLKVALVPFEGSVNVGVNTSNPPYWIDWSDEARAHYNGINFDLHDIDNDGDDERVGHKWLYNKLGISWAGCVEMRAEPYDVLDTVPDTASPDTLFVPMFWPDEPDSSSAWNNYIDDRYGRRRGPSWEDAQSDVDKYDESSPSRIDWHSGRKDTTYPYTYGPNRGCPRPITPLTSTESTVLTAINAMQAQGATGTFIPVGLAWGWHVLSPTEPFTEGLGPSDEDYSRTVKAIVLLTDGENSPSISVTGYYNKNEGTYSAYNYPATEGDNSVGGNTYYRRLQNVNVNSDPSESRAVTNLNNKTLTLCTNAKSAGIRLYTITFGNLSSTAETLMSNCASVDSSGDPLYFSAPNSNELENIFHTIGEDLSEIHLAM